MFCRFCGAHLLEDSVFCSKCGKRTGRAVHPRWDKVYKTLHLGTPYPYTILLLLLVVLWALSPHGAAFDYTSLKWTLQQDRKLDLPDEDLYQQGLSLVLENAGNRAVKEIPVELSARIEPPQPADIAASFLGNHVPIMQKGKSMPLIVVLADEIPPGGKRTYLMEGSIQAHPPFKVTFELRDEKSESIFANFVVER